MRREVLWTGNCVPAGNVNLIFDVGRDDDDDAASGDGDRDHLCEICRVHCHDPGEAGRPGEGQPDARTELAADLEKVVKEVLRRKEK